MTHSTFTKTLTIFTLIVSALAIAMTLAGCGGMYDTEVGDHAVKMTFDGSNLQGNVHIGEDGRGKWEASNPENLYSGDVITSESDTVWWFGDANSSAFSVQTVGGRSTDPAIPMVIEVE